MSVINYAVRTLTILGAFAGVFGIVRVWNVQAQNTPNLAATDPPMTPPVKPYVAAVAGTGIFESWGENVSLGVPTPGLVKEVVVGVNDQVKKGQQILKMDDSELQANLINARASVTAAEGDVAVAQASLERAADFVKRIPSNDTKIISKDEVANRQFEERIAKAQLTAAQGKLTRAQAEVQSLTMLLNKLTVLAPRDGTILQVNVRAGEFANTALASGTRPAIMLGDLSSLQVRVDIDEQNATRVRAGQNAICYLKGDTQHALPLTFVRLEPYIIPKSSLTGSSTERVDTRVLQLIYKYVPSPTVTTFVGQQVDVFIEN